MKVLYSRKTRRNAASLFDSLISDRLNRVAEPHANHRGHKMAVFANDRIGISINAFGAYEGDELLTLFEFLAPIREEMSEGVALDVGANIGNHSIEFSRHFREVHAFEPNPPTFHLLQFNASFRQNIVAHNFGLGDEGGVFHLTECATNMGQSAIVESGSVEVVVKKLDDLDLAAPILLKMDVEGFELRVISGGSETIRKHQPIIAFEQHAHDFEDGDTPTIRALRDRGYRFCWIETGTSSKNMIVRRLATLLEFASGGRSHKVVTGPDVPVRTHSLLIAVPEKYRRALGV